MYGLTELHLRQFSLFLAQTRVPGFLRLVRHVLKCVRVCAIPRLIHHCVAKWKKYQYSYHSSPLDFLHRYFCLNNEYIKSVGFLVKCLHGGTAHLLELGPRPLMLNFPPFWTTPVRFLPKRFDYYDCVHVANPFSFPMGFRRLFDW